MAAPHVAGAAALLKGFRPELTPLEIKNIILASVDKKPQFHNKVSTGGTINIIKMFETIFKINHVKTASVSIISLITTIAIVDNPAMND